MRVLHLSYSDLAGGAAVSAFRLHQSLRSAGVDSHMLVAKKDSSDPHVRQHPKFSSKFARALLARVEPKLLRYLAGRQVLGFSMGFLGTRTRKQIEALAPDLLNLHWTNSAFLSVEDVARLSLPMVWTLHDMWSFTGGCHYAYECEGYRTACGHCPQLASGRERDTSRRIFERKQRAWREVPFRIVTPSEWLGDCARSSTLFGERDVDIIPYGIDLELYHPQKREAGRAALGVGDDVPLLLFGALASTADQRKGYDLLVEALGKAREELAAMSAEIVVFGGSERRVATDEVTGLRAHHLGHIGDEEALARIYAAADVFVAPSRADNFPNTVLESIGCGTPVAAFDVGGMPDMVLPGQTGTLAPPFDTESLASGMVASLRERGDRERRARIRENAEKKYAARIQAHRYREFYAAIAESA